MLHCITASAQTGQGRHIAEGVGFIAAVQADGTVKAVGDNTYGQCDTSDWRNVTAVAVGLYHTLGLKKDGTVYAAGRNDIGQCDVQEWKDIVMVAAAYRESYGLTREGTVLRTDHDSSIADIEMPKWKDIAWIDGFVWYVPTAIDKNGDPFVVGVDFLGDVHDVRQVYETFERLYLLKTDGTIQYVNSREGEEYDYGDHPEILEMDRDPWSDIIELDLGEADLIALKRDGTVVVRFGVGYIRDWTDIVEIEGGGFGVKRDGSIVIDHEFVEDYTPEQLAEISTWKVMVDPETLPVTAPQTVAP